MNELFEMALPENGMNVLYTRSSAIHGIGLFTAIAIPAGTILCRRLGLKTQLSLRDKRAIIGIDGYDSANPDDYIFKSINHSCQPNTLFTDTGCLINIWPLEAQSEITLDYGPMIKGSGWSAICHCGFSGCRHIINGEPEPN